MCVCLSLILTHSHPHTRREGADDLVWSKLDSPLLPPLPERGLPERGLSAGDQDDSLSWKGFGGHLHVCTITSIVHECMLYLTTFRRVCMCCVSLADLICMHDFSVLELVSLSHLAPSPPYLLPLPPLFLSLFPPIRRPYMCSITSWEVRWTSTPVQLD